MSKEMIISVNGREKKIAIIEDGQVTEFYIERGEDNSGVVGNIYKGRVQRVLPGMQSAFVDIGLERDAFLYVSDFFDEQEEIERIVMEKGKKKASPDDADKEVTDELHKTRLKRDKKIDNEQEKAEIEVKSDDDADDTGSSSEQKSKRKRGRRRKKKEEPKKEEQKETSEDKEDKDSEDQKDERSEELKIPTFEFENSGFERIVDEDDEEDEETGEMLKDAMTQEAIIDKVRAIEFDMESTDSAEVGSLIDAVGDEDNGFERIVDEEEVEEIEEPKEEKKTRTRRSRKSTKTSTRRRRKSTTKKDSEEKEEKKEEQEVEEKAAEEESKEKEEKKTTRRKRSTRAKKGTAAKKTTRRRKTKKDAEEEKNEQNKEKEDTAEVESEANAEAKTKEAEEEKPKKTATRRRRTTKSKTTRGRKTSTRKKTTSTRKKTTKKDEEEKTVPDAEASVNDSTEVSEMAVRRGSRGGGRRRRNTGGKNPAKTKTHMDKGYKTTDSEKPITADAAIASAEFRSSGNGRRKRREKKQPKISDLLHEGQEVLVQIAKEPIARKGARITSHIALPGRYLVFMPTIEHLGVSRKIDSAKERGRLRNLLQKVIKSEKITSGGFIVRTAGTGKSESEIRDDARYLTKTWQDIKKDAEKSKSPELIHQDLDIVQRLIRDQLSDDFTAIRVDSEEEYLRTVEFINRIQPKMVKRVKFHTLDQPILETYGVASEVDKALKHRVWLKSGGYLVINQTEALIAIDVNTGKFVGKGNERLEDTITKTNLEAVKEISRQIRLRDLGGIIVLDLIDMEDRRNRQKVLQALQEHLSNDKSPTKVLSFNDFGLIIMTRKRVKQSLERTLCSPCSYCEGAGWIKSTQTICYEILEEARSLSKNLSDVRQTTLRVHPEVAETLRTAEKEVLDEIEEYLGIVDLTGDSTIHHEQYDFAFI